MKTKESNSEGSKPRNLLISTAEAPCIIQPHTPRNVLSVLQNRSLAFSHFMFHGGIFLCFKWDGIPAFPRHTPNASTVPFLPHDAKSLRLISAAFPSAEILIVSSQLIHFCKTLGVSYLSFLTAGFKCCWREKDRWTWDRQSITFTNHHCQKFISLEKVAKKLIVHTTT